MVRITNFGSISVGTAIFQMLWFPIAATVMLSYTYDDRLDGIEGVVNQEVSSISKRTEPTADLSQTLLPPLALHSTLCTTDWRN